MIGSVSSLPLLLNSSLERSPQPAAAGSAQTPSAAPAGYRAATPAPRPLLAAPVVPVLLQAAPAADATAIPVAVSRAQNAYAAAADLAPYYRYNASLIPGRVTIYASHQNS